MANGRRSARRKYNRASTSDEDDGDHTEKPHNSSDKEKNPIEIKILDSAQNKFTIPSIDPNTTTVQQLKEIGLDIHSVPPDQQHLIYMGRLLSSNTTGDDGELLNLSDYGIEADGCIIHLSEKNPIEIKILDSAQNKFTIPSIYPNITTVQQLKEIGLDIHSVPPDQQRLIYMGRLLSSDTTGDDGELLNLSDYGIKKDGCIIHLFPKPKVVIDRTNINNGETDLSLQSPNQTDPSSSATDQDGGSGNDSAAHIPEIIVDASEAERHSNVIILSSHEAFEILHRVRLCAFCLLVYSSMELLQDFTLWMGAVHSENDNNIYSNAVDDDIPPDDPTDTTTPGRSDDEFGGDMDTVPQEWESIDFVDIAVSVFALWVSLLGIKVTTEHELVTARLFCNVLIVLAVIWNVFNYLITVRDIKRLKERHSEEDEPSVDDIWPSNNSSTEDSNDTDAYQLALWYMSFLLFLWGIFLFWAHQFRKLMEEAASEAEERTRSFFTDVGDNTTTTGSDEVVNDLELQVEGRVIT